MNFKNNVYNTWFTSLDLAVDTLFYIGLENVPTDYIEKAISNIEEFTHQVTSLKVLVLEYPPDMLSGDIMQNTVEEYDLFCRLRYFDLKEYIEMFDRK